MRRDVGADVRRGPGPACARHTEKYLSEASPRSRRGDWHAVSMTPWQPVLDGDVIPERPIDRIVSGASADIDALVGTNIDEWRLFLALGGLIDQVTDEALAGAVAAYGLPVEKTVAGYPRGASRRQPW